MSKKVCLVLLIISLVTPISYASYMVFIPPKMIKAKIEYPKPVNRSAYKPYPGGRTDSYIYDYEKTSSAHIRSVGNDFKRIGNQYDSAIKYSDSAMKDFDTIASSSY